MDLLNVPRVFFIKGVFKHTAKNIEKVVAESKIPTSVKMQDHPTGVEYNGATPMAKFYDTDDEPGWANERRVKCKTCNRHITGWQIPIPENVERVRGAALRFKPHDTCRFHDWGCAAYHILYFLRNDSRFKMQLNKLYELKTGRSVLEITPVTHPHEMIDMGGDKTREEWDRINEAIFARFQSSFDREDETLDESSFNG